MTVFWQEIANIGNSEPGGETSLKREMSQQQEITWFFSTLSPNSQYLMNLYLMNFISLFLFCGVPCVLSIDSLIYIYGMMLCDLSERCKT